MTTITNIGDTSKLATWLQGLSTNLTPDVSNYAKGMKKLFPNAPKALGQLIGRSGTKYGLVCIQSPQGRYGAFQSKYDWFKPSTLELIQFSVTLLRDDQQKPRKDAS